TSRGDYRPSRVSVGTEHSIGLKATLNYYTQDLFSSRKPLLDYHTHPSEGLYFSEYDIAFYVSNPRLASIHLVGNMDGIAAVIPDNSLPVYKIRKFASQDETL